jgi:death on curing protein
MKEPQWIESRALLLLHAESVAEHGGLPGIRDEGLLESALARPQNHFAYKKRCDLADLAAAYAFGISQNHPFKDGNKRIAFLAAALFLELNGVELAPEPVAAVNLFFSLAAGRVSEKEIAEWIRNCSSPLPPR